MSPARYKYLRAEDIRRLASYEFAPRALVEGYLAGRHRSRTRGPSTEFRDYRQYVPGDDLKSVDWRVYARTDRYFLRTYELETNMGCHILLDSSASMGFGRGLSKLEYASFFAAALSYLVTKSGDRVSLLLFDEKIRQFHPPGSTNRHLQNLMNTLERNEPGQPTSLATALTRAFPLMPRRGMLVILSDFFDDPGAILTALNPYVHRGFSIHLFHVLAPEELDLEDRGLVAFHDLETRQRVVAHTDHLRTKYREAMQAHIQNLRQLAVRRRIDYTVARTDTHYFALFDKLTR